MYSDFSEVKNSKVGEVIALASGPSASLFPLKSFSHVSVIAMNGSIIKCHQDNLRPLFYICDDEDFIHNRPELAKLGVELSDNVAMAQSCYEALASIYPGLLSGKKLFVLERVNRSEGRPILSDRRFAWSIRKDPDLVSGFSLLSKKPNRIGFSSNLSKGYFGSRTIPYAGVQLAKHLGFEKVFMVGVDMTPAAGRFYETGEAAMPSTLEDDFEKYILPSFSLMAKKILRESVFEVFNLSPDSRIPSNVIKKINIEEFIEIVNVNKI